MNDINRYSQGFNYRPSVSEKELKTAAEKKSLKRASNSIGGAFLIMTVSVNIISIILTFAVLAITKNQALISSSGFLWIQQCILSALGFSLPFILAARLMKFRVSNLIPCKPVRTQLLIPLIIICMGAFMVGNYSSSMFGSFISTFGIKPSQGDIGVPTGALGTVFYLVSISAIPAIFEEFALRGVVMGSLRRFGDGFAIFVSAALFGLMHGNLIQIPFAFVCGLALGYVDIVAGSIWPSVIAHFINNLLASILSDYTGALSDTVQSLISFSYPLVIIVAALIAVLVLLKQKPDAFRLPKATTTMRGGEKLGTFIATPCMILALISFAFSVVLTQLAF